MTDPELAAIIESVRDKTTSDGTLLPDDRILAWVDEAGPNRTSGGTLDLLGVVADAWEYLARADIYGSNQAGSVAWSQPQAWNRALHYRSQSLRGSGVSVTVARKSRGDLIADPTVAAGSEHGT